MSFRSIDVAEIREVLRRWQAGQSLRSIAQATRLDRKTVRRYVRVAEAVRMAATASLDDETLGGIVWAVKHRSDRVSEMQHVLASQSERIRGWLMARNSLAAVHLRLRRLGVLTSYATLRRFAIRDLAWQARAAPHRRAA